MAEKIFEIRLNCYREIKRYLSIIRFDNYAGQLNDDIFLYVNHLWFLSKFSYFGLRSSWINLSRSLKHPKLAIACKTSGSMASTDGITCVCTTSIIDNSNSNSPFPAAVTHTCLFISASWKIISYIAIY